MIWTYYDHIMSTTEVTIWEYNTMICTISHELKISSSLIDYGRPCVFLDHYSNDDFILLCYKENYNIWVNHLQFVLIWYQNKSIILSIITQSNDLVKWRKINIQQSKSKCTGGKILSRSNVWVIQSSTENIDIKIYSLLSWKLFLSKR